MSQELVSELESLISKYESSEESVCPEEIVGDLITVLEREHSCQDDDYPSLYEDDENEDTNADELDRIAAELDQAFITYEAKRAPKGGVNVQGTFYPGGEFIPSDVMAKATAGERAAVEGNGAPPEKQAAKQEPAGKQPQAKPGAGDGTPPERIQKWVSGNYNPKHVGKITQDLIDVAAGNREGNEFEKKALAKIFPEWKPAAQPPKPAGHAGDGKAAASPASASTAGAPQAKQAASSLSPIAREPHTPPPPGSAYSPDPNKDATGDGVTDAARVGVPGMSLPPPPPIPRLPKLTTQERAAESNFATMYERDPDGMARTFLAKLQKRELGDAPNVFATDDAKFLSPDWNPPGVSATESRDAKAQFNTACHQTANAIAKRAFSNYLRDVVSKMPAEQRRVLVTAGGVAAGKGYAISKVEEVNQIASKVAAVWDSAGEQNGTENPWVMAECAKYGVKALFVYVHADPTQTWENPKRGVVERANAKGRMVDARVFADSYAIGAKNFDSFMKANRDKANFVVLDNTGKPWTKPDGTVSTDPRQLDAVPPEALNVDVEGLYARSLNYLKSAEGINPSVKRGGSSGERIWGAPKTNEVETALTAIKAGELGKVEGWPVRRTGENEWRIDTSTGVVQGDAKAIQEHIDHDKASRKLEGRALSKALDRVKDYKEPDLFADHDRAMAEAKAFGKLAAGTRVVSLEPGTKGRVGTIHRVEENGQKVNKVRLDGDAGGWASDFVEPLDERLSWRGQQQPREHLTQGRLFEGEASPAQYEGETVHPSHLEKTLATLAEALSRPPVLLPPAPPTQDKTQDVLAALAAMAAGQNRTQEMLAVAITKLAAGKTKKQIIHRDDSGAITRVETVEE